MKSCGVIVEYNPFHNGHMYHLQKAREVSQAEVIVAVMSGNFLQRGEPAIIDKWQRAQLALENGADLVIELPFAYAVQSADYFANGGVKLLQALGVDSLCFGTDTATPVDYQVFAEFNQIHKKELAAEFQLLKNNGMSYPQQMTTVYRKLYPELELDYQSPNHILGMSYAKANQEYAKPMILTPIQREVAGHHQETVESKEFASGTAIRKVAFAQDFDLIKPVVPKATLALLESQPLSSWEKAWPLLKYQLLVSSTTELADIYQVVEGIEYRLKEMALKAQSFDEFVSLVKTKRFTWTRIQRLATYILLQVKKTDVAQVWQDSYLRILGFTETGRAFLGQQRKDVALPLVSKIGKSNEAMLALDIKAGLLYQQLVGNKEIQDYYRQPIYVTEKQ